MLIDEKARTVLVLAGLGEGGRVGDIGQAEAVAASRQRRGVDEQVRQKAPHARNNNASIPTQI